eukprot:comp23013_c1_seq1/m.36718 comp23013_c1_seq1/g.36718  ORF comp23013_c1_seq1/g.36718 comp23013_c1_seq1/m.36718 type:complete len:321 (-) comp23013_c1_seq1:80-1042(-)
MSLFPTAQTPKSGNLIEFRAGRMNKEGKMVTPDVRKGLVYLVVRDGLLHFCWKDRKSGKEEEALIIFPSDAEFKKVKQTNQRVYLLSFSGTSRKYFFWMQEPKDEKDLEIVRKVNYLINNPPSSNSGDPFAGVDLDKLDAPGMDVTPAAAAPAPAPETPAPAPAPSAAPAPSSEPASTPLTGASSVGGHAPTAAELSALQQLLSGIRMPDNVSMNDVLSPDVLSPLLSDPQSLEVLKPFLPPPHTPEAMQSLIKSPQFAQAMHAFNAALKSGQVAPAQLGVGTDTNQTAGVEAFLKALQADVDKSTGESSANSGDKMETD